MTGGSFGPYRLTGELGRSAMGAVYRAVDPSGRQVALKLVGSLPAGASQFGCLDMAGTVWEWTADGWGDYPPPAEPAEVASERASRGGSRDNSSPWCRSTNRGHLRASSKVNYLGLRVAR
jgi:formylglycine-generating enzyme required for sulfatase activity